jgi:hypothetical protein
MPLAGHAADFKSMGHDAMSRPGRTPGQNVQPSNGSSPDTRSFIHGAQSS